MPGGLDADEEFARSRRGEVEVLHRERARFGIRPLETDLFEYGATDPHAYSLPLLRDCCHDQ